MAFNMGAFQALDSREMMAVDGGSKVDDSRTLQYVICGLMVVASACLMVSPATCAMGALGMDVALS